MRLFYVIIVYEYTIKFSILSIPNSQVRKMSLILQYFVKIFFYFSN